MCDEKITIENFEELLLFTILKQESDEIEEVKQRKERRLHGEMFVNMIRNKIDFILQENERIKKERRIFKKEIKRIMKERRMLKKEVKRLKILFQKKISNGKKKVSSPKK